MKCIVDNFALETTDVSIVLGLVVMFYRQFENSDHEFFLFFVKKVKNH